MSEELASFLKDRILGFDRKPASQFLFNPSNWRKHPQPQRDAVRASLGELGWIDVVIENRQTGHLLDGHERIWNALQIDEDEPVPYIQVDLTPEEEKLALWVIDGTAAMAETDKEALDALLRDINTGEEALQAALADAAEAVGLYFGDKPEEADAEPQVNRAEELREQWGVETGQLWRLPSRTPGQEHRLICGDCTDAAVVDRVMGGEFAEMVWTDPPYGVAIGDKNVFLNSIARSNRIEENIENDTLDELALAEMLRRSFENGLSHCLAGGAWYVAAPAGPLHVLFGQILKDKNIWRQTIQWVKNNATFSPLGVCYHWQAEPIFFGWQPGAAHRFYGGRQQTTVWEIDRPLKSPEHPTMKPVELVERAINNSSKVSEIVLELYNGSGTTIIAAENLTRQCRAIEISPAYVAVALQRYLDAFGIMPELIDRVDT